MTAPYHICLATAGWGVWHSPDAGQTWTRHRAPFPLNSRMQAFAVHPIQPQTLYVGGDTGLFVSQDGGANWQNVVTQEALPTIWSLAIDPVDPDILFAGTRPAGVYRSRDGGHKWEQCPVDIAPKCSIGTPFVTSLMIDPDDHLTIWAGVEIDGVFRSTDGGDSWTHVEHGLNDPDIHDMTLAGSAPRRVIASTARDMFTSVDSGASWQSAHIKEKWPLPYARGMAVKTDDPGVLFAGCGESTTGDKGHILRTTDFGSTWDIVTLPTAPNSTIWGLATHPANADIILAFSLFGEVYCSEDGGNAWRKIEREFGEIRAIAWVPS